MGKHAALKGMMSDYWKPYEYFIPETTNTQSKAEIYTLEGYNG